MTYRVLVFGSRTWARASLVYQELNLIAAHVPVSQIVVVHGDNPNGADLHADVWARLVGATPEPHPADWAKYGRRAGNIRNSEMAAEGADEALGFIYTCRAPRCKRPRPHDSHGSADMWAKAVAAGIPTRIVRP